ncbi:stalk domain-containing protein [Paenibacillus sp. GCM10027626]|uniref:stalk domain-containing protein n=1 Tax=Paenibacillus sp. GCM10027626 TaxID=3273411 RepID=UPI0036265944
MKKLTRLLIVTLVISLIASFQVSAASAAVIKNVQTAIKLNGNDFVPGAPIKTIDGNLMVPLKSIVKQLGMELTWNSKGGGYRINGFHKVILLKPGSKLTKVFAINSSNFNRTGYDKGYFLYKMERMPAPLSNQGGIYYISLKWLANQYGLTLSSQSGIVHVTGSIKPYSTDHIKTVYQALIKQDVLSEYDSTFASFLRTQYNEYINIDFREFNRDDLLPLIGQTYWLYDRFNVAVAWSNQGVTLPRFAKIQIVDEYSYEESIIGYNNKLYRINNSFISNLLNADPKKHFNWSKRVWDAIADYRVHIGMTREQAIWGWGEPEYINKTTTSYGTFEQWVYGNYNYLYFNDGVLTSIQN